MKTKTFILLLFFILTHTVHAQLDNPEPKHKWGCSVAINSFDAQVGEQEWNSWGYAKGNFNNFGSIKNNSLSLSVIPKYFIRNDILLRFEFGTTNITLTNYYDNNADLTSSNPISHSTINQSIDQKIYRYIPGIQWNFMKKKFMESYCGMTASYLQYSKMEYSNTLESRDLPSNKYTGGFEDRATAEGGFASGIGAIAGFNIYLQKHISFGAEFSSTLLYKKIGGAFSGVITNISTSAPPSLQIYSYSTSSYKGF
ncbi:MAG: DUF3575 domain-containing protein, partial [Bacteroidetes bacterium]|nr:DUF3575 domain-containing protein [Bacteroidota bacterium]